MSAFKQRVQKSFAHAAEVTEVVVLSPRLRSIRLKSSSLRSCSWRPGDKVKLAVGPKMRSYTPARVDVEAGWMDIIFFLHGGGAASEWASTVAVGDRTGFIGPARSMPPLSQTPEHALFLGDETTIGLAVALLDALPESVSVQGAIELSAEDAPALAALGLALQPAIREAEHGAALSRWLSGATLSTQGAIAWLSGEAGAVLALRETLMAGEMERSQLKIKPYWSTKGHAHRKSLQRGL